MYEDLTPEQKEACIKADEQFEKLCYQEKLYSDPCDYCSCKCY